MTTPAANALPAGIPARFPAEPYKPDGGFSPAGLGMLLSALAIAGAAVGFVAYFISKAFYLIVLFPILIGLLLGWIGKLMVRKGRVRNPWMGALAGFLGGLFAMTMMHYFAYESFRKEARANEDFMSWVNVSPAERASEWAARRTARDASKPSFAVPKPINEITLEQQEIELEREIAALNSFPAFMNLQAMRGVEIKSTRGSSSSSKPLNLGFTGSWIYWGVEVLIVAGIAFFMVKGEAAKPFCRECGDWKTERFVGGFGGDPESAKAGVNSGDFTQLAAAGPVHPSQPSATQLLVAECGICKGTQGTADVRLVQFHTNPQGKTSEKVLAHASWPGQSPAALDALFAAQTPPVDPNAAPPATGTSA